MEALTSELAKTDEWRLVRRVIESPRFARSAKLSDFLMFVTERALTGHVDEITEQQVGVHVFGRPAGFDSGSDSIVRSQARLLRQRLEQYFEDEGKAEPVVIRIPRGAYVPEFAPRQSAAEPVAAKAAATLPAEVQPEMRRGWGLVAITLLLAASMAAAAWRWSATGDRAGTPASARHPLWHQLADAQHNTLILPADSALVLLQNLTGRPVTLAEYANGDYRRGLRSPYGLPGELLENLANRQYTSMADVNLIDRMTRQMHAIPSANVAVKFCRFARVEDLKQSHVVLLGVKQANPWVELFEERLNFRFEYAGPELSSYRVVNRHPLTGEAAEYRQIAGDPRRLVYASIALLPNLSGTGNVLILQGTTMAGTEAAVDFAFQKAALERSLGRAPGSSGPLPFFELFLQSATLANNAQESRVLAMRIL